MAKYFIFENKTGKGSTITMNQKTKSDNGIINFIIVKMNIKRNNWGNREIHFEDEFQRNLNKLDFVTNTCGMEYFENFDI